MSYTNPDGPFRSRRRVFFGVCGGLADHFNFSRFWTRMLVLGGFVVTGFWPVGVLYLVLALLMRREPRTGSMWSWRAEPCTAGGGLDDRMRRMEAKVRAQQYDWDARLRRG